MDWVDKFFDEIYPAEIVLQHQANDEKAEREADFIVSQLDIGPSSRVLDLACGHGRHALRIAPRAGSIVGIDRTGSYIKAAAASAIGLGVDNAEFLVQDMRELNFDGEFDAGYNYFTAWGYYDDDTNLDVLRRACRSMKPGGRFLLEFIGRDALMRRFQPQGYSKRDDGTVVLQERSFDFQSGRMHVEYTLISSEGRKSITIDLRIPSPDELLRIFATAGFVNCGLVEAPGGGDVTLDSFRVAVIGERPAGSGS